MNTSFQLYRGAKIGDCLYQSLFELIEAGKLSEELADKVLAQFDKSMYHALEEKVVEKRALIKANLKSYRYIDSVWQFVLDKVTLKVRCGAVGCGLCVPSGSILVAELFGVRGEQSEDSDLSRGSAWKNCCCGWETLFGMSSER